MLDRDGTRAGTTRTRRAAPPQSVPFVSQSGLAPRSVRSDDLLGHDGVRVAGAIACRLTQAQTPTSSPTVPTFAASIGAHIRSRVCA